MSEEAKPTRKGGRRKGTPNRTSPWASRRYKPGHISHLEPFPEEDGRRVLRRLLRELPMKQLLKILEALDNAAG